MSDQTTLNLELPDRKILRLCKLKSGDVIFQIDERITPRQQPNIVTIATLPENRRAVLIRFLA